MEFIIQCVVKPPALAVGSVKGTVTGNVTTNTGGRS